MVRVRAVGGGNHRCFSLISNNETRDETRQKGMQSVREQTSLTCCVYLLVHKMPQVLCLSIYANEFMRHTA
jgi:hypothetical protein